MIGGTALTFQDLGWLPRHETPFEVPGWMGAWFEMYSYWETLGAQVVAGVFVIGSYAAAKHVKVTRRVRRGEAPAQRAVGAPGEATRDAVLA